MYGAKMTELCGSDVFDIRDILRGVFSGRKTNRANGGSLLAVAVAVKMLAKTHRGWFRPGTTSPDCRNPQYRPYLQYAHFEAGKVVPTV